MDLLSGEMVRLVPATIDDRAQIYEWLANSNLTQEMLGPPKYPEVLIPSWKEFCDDYLEHYFTEEEALRGRCFIIFSSEEKVGQINYNEIHINTHSTELDIWLVDKKFTAKGFGIEAIQILCNYLFQVFNCNTFYLAPSQRNTQAIHAYRKAGFVETEEIPDFFVPDYQDAVLMVKNLSSLSI